MSTSYDLAEVVKLAQPAKPLRKKVSATSLALAEKYRDAGFVQAADEIGKDAVHKLKRARIAEFEYQVLTKKMFQKWLNGLKFKVKKPKKKPGLYEWRILTVGASVAWDEEMLQFTNSNGQRLSVGASGVVGVTSVIASREIKGLETAESYTTIELKEVNVEDYKHIPPEDVIDKLIEAKSQNVFDTFVVIYPTLKKHLKDPLLCGKIKEEPEKWYYIAEWGDDIKLKDLV